MNLQTRPEQSDATEVVEAAGSAFELGHDLDIVRSRHIGAPFAYGRGACFLVDPRLGEYASRWRCPARGRFVQDAHGEHVEAADIRILPPVQHLAVVPECVIRAEYDQLAELAQKAILDHAANRLMLFQSKRTGNNLRDEFGMSLSGSKHPVRLAGVTRHASFRQHVLAGFQGGAGNLAMQVGPRPNHHGIKIGIFNQGLPMRILFGDAEFLGRLSGGLGRPIHDTR